MPTMDGKSTVAAVDLRGGCVLASDGTRLTHLTQGSGPVPVFVHGALAAATSEPARSGKSLPTRSQHQITTCDDEPVSAGGSQPQTDTQARCGRCRRGGRNPLLSACAPGVGGGSSGGKTTLQFWDMDWGGTENLYQKAALQLVHEYETTNPDVTIDYRILPWTTYYQAFAAAIAGGTTPDLSTGATYQGFQYDSDLVSLNSVANEWKSGSTSSDIVPGSVQAQVDSSGKVTGLPWEIDCRVVTYRADLLKDAGIDTPTTMAEIYDASVALGKAGRAGSGSAETSSAIRCSFPSSSTTEVRCLTRPARRPW